MTDRRRQLRELYGLDFPDELFAFAEWHGSLTGEAERAFGEVLGLTLRGPFDALACKLDGLELRYPAVLHWRYQYDLPELFTVMIGDTDGLHWGYWFDDPGRLPPLVASYYARDGVDLVEHASLSHALAAHIRHSREDIADNRKHDRAHDAEYVRDLAALDALEASKPPRTAPVTRSPIAATPDGMGIVVAPEQLVAWEAPETVDRDSILAFVDAEIAAQRPGTALLVGRTLWDGSKRLALDVFIRAYRALDREPLHTVAVAHRTHPAIPSLDIASYRPGDYTDFADAVAHASDVRTLTMRTGVRSDGDYSSLVELVELDLAAAGISDLPPSLARCTKLTNVSLYNNRLTRLPAALCGLPSLRTLQLGRNQISVLDGVGTLSALRTLDLSDNPLREVPVALGDLTSLEELVLGRCPIERLPDLSGLTRLVRLVLTDTLLGADEYARVRAALPGAEIIGTPIAAGSKPYSPKSTYAVGDSLAHPSFGPGTVRAVHADNRIEVAFSTGTRTLAHRR